jgi:hypothetical protein
MLSMPSLDLELILDIEAFDAPEHPMLHLKPMGSNSHSTDFWCGDTSQ